MARVAARVTDKRVLKLIRAFLKSGVMERLGHGIPDGPALASGIAWVNSVGILGGSASPPIVGWFKDVTGSFSGGLYALAIFGLFAALVAAICVRETPVAVAQQPIGATAD
jgi:nitrate/nitrite transporter NarK